MYKVYRDPKGENVNLGINTSDQQQRSTFQCNEDTYKLQIQKLNGEVAVLRKRVIIVATVQYKIFGDKKLVNYSNSPQG